ncbi:MAG: Holliday junction resolvase RuvX [Patescibacteria group bacterium]
MRYLGIDYGTRKIGLAVSDLNGNFAYPHSVIVNNKNFIREITRLCQKEQIEQIVIGESLNLKGDSNPIMEEIKNFAAKLTEVSSLPVAWEKEFYTTQEADRLVGRNEETDARAAALILKNYLDKHRE